jgi:hypothetical protein
MKRSTIAPFLVIPALILVACTGAISGDATEPPPQQAPMSDTFFTGCAYLDQDADGLIDAEDPLLGGFTYTFTLAGGAGFGGETTDGQCGMVTVPSGLSSDAWPVVARMAVPERASYKAIGASEITLQHPRTKAEFLFASE